jgi:uncharacterized protein (TIGR02246 family)
MKTNIHLITGIVITFVTSTGLRAEEASPEIAGLEKAAAGFVAAYNNRDSAALANLFTESGEMTNLTGTNLTTGREQIQARYEEIFAEKPLQIAIEVDSVRLVAPGVAIEDGTYHLTPADDENAPPKSIEYTAVLTKSEGGEWRIASTRSLRDVTEAAGRLAPLADVLKGEWTYTSPEGVRVDLAFGWDSTGKYLSGEILTTTADAEPQEGTIRIAWDASKEQIVSWMFDAAGGFTHGVWTAVGDGWLIQSEGTTADGESLSASQKLSAENKDTIIWAVTQRVIDDKSAPDMTLRMVRQAPEPSEE